MDVPHQLLVTIPSFFATEAESHMINQAVLRKQVFPKVECKLCPNPSKVGEFALKTPGYELRPPPLTPTKSG